MSEFLLLRHRNIGEEGLAELDEYLRLGGFQAFRKVVTQMSPQQVIDLVKASGLRGRGGAGFPTGI